LAEAYAVQDAYRDLLTPAHGPVGGYKIALTSEVMQRLVGVPHPLAGPLFAATIRRAPATLRAVDFVRLGVECEFAVRLGRDLAPADAPFSQDAIAAAIDGVAPAFELVEDRNADYTRLDALGIIADNCWNAGVVLGPFHGGLPMQTLSGLIGRLEIDGIAAGEGRGADVLGDPQNALVWLATHLAGRGERLRRGMIVMTGSIIATKFLHAGNGARFVVDGLGEAKLRVV
jgi:2-oxo-3-hexenedioate decarboxylase/2-keto-4-pentenoate hydratase